MFNQIKPRHYKIPCYTCEHYRTTGNPEIGLCMKLDDSSGLVPYVSSSRQECLFNLTKQPKQLTPEEAKARDKTLQEKRKQFWEYCERVAKEAKSWSDWKKRVLSNIL